MSFIKQENPPIGSEGGLSGDGEELSDFLDRAGLPALEQRYVRRAFATVSELPAPVAGPTGLTLIKIRTQNRARIDQTCAGLAGSEWTVDQD